MADEEVGSTHYAEERWSLLNSLKCTVENILMSNFENGKVTTGSSPHVEFDLERIFEHGLRKNQVRISLLFLLFPYTFQIQASVHERPSFGVKDHKLATISCKFIVISVFGDFFLPIVVILCSIHTQTRIFFSQRKYVSTFNSLVVNRRKEKN